MSQNWAICIGIDRYDNLQSLQYAKRDAEVLRDFFEKEAGFDKVYYFAEDAPPIPTDFGEPMRSMPSGGTLRRFLRVRFEQKFRNSQAPPLDGRVELPKQQVTENRWTASD